MNPSLAGTAWACGLAMLIPLPWVDEYVERRLTRSMYRALAEAHGVALPEAALDTLTEDRGNVAIGCLLAIVKWPLKKLFRTVVYVLTVKDVIDGATRAAHRATLVDIALAEGLLPGHAEGVRTVMDELLGKIRISPVTRPLWRQERPALLVPDDAPAQARALHWLQRHGGGGVLLPLFHERLAALRSGA